MGRKNFGGKTADARARTLARLEMKAGAGEISPKEARRLKKMAKQVAKAADRQEVKDTRGWTKLTMNATCGCCTAELYYRTRERAEAAARSAAAKHLTLTDDRGAAESVDGFYGFALSPNNDIDPAAPPP